MKSMLKRAISLLLVLALVCSLLPAVFAANAENATKEPLLLQAASNSPITEEAEEIINADIWDVIDALEDKKVVATRDDPITVEDYAELSWEVEALVRASDTYVEGSLVRNGEDNTFFTWETTEGIVCGYAPEVRYRTRNLDTENMAGENITTKIGVWKD